MMKNIEFEPSQAMLHFHPWPSTLGAYSCIIRHTVRCGLALMVFVLCGKGKECTQTLLKLQLNHIIPILYRVIYPHQAIHALAMYQDTSFDSMVQVT